MTRDVIVIIDRGWGLLMVFEPFSKSSGGLSYILLITLHSITFISIDDPTLFRHWILVLGGHQEVFDGDTSSEVYLYPMFVASSFHTFTKSFVVGYNHIGTFGNLLGCCCCQCFSSFGQVSSSSFLLYWLLMWGTCTWLGLLKGVSSSLFNLSGLEQTVFALWCSVPTTLYFEEMGWWLSHFRYMSVWVGFLQTVVFSLPSSVGVINMVIYDFHDEIDDSKLLTSELNSTETLLWRNSMWYNICDIHLCNNTSQFWSVVLFWEWKY